MHFLSKYCVESLTLALSIVILFSAPFSRGVSGVECEVGFCTVVQSSLLAPCNSGSVRFHLQKSTRNAERCSSLANVRHSSQNHLVFFVGVFLRVGTCLLVWLSCLPYPKSGGTFFALSLHSFHSENNVYCA